MTFGYEGKAVGSSPRGLSMEAVSQQKNTCRGVAEEIAQKETSGIQYWQTRIASARAKQFRCRVLYRSYRKGYRDIIVIGMPDDAATCSRATSLPSRAGRSTNWSRRFVIQWMTTSRGATDTGNLVRKSDGARRNPPGSAASHILSVQRSKAVLPAM